MSESDSIAPVMYILVNSDLKMSPGKIASQVGHVVQLITEEIIRDGYEINPPSETYFTYMKWKNNCTKIVLKASFAELKDLIKTQPECRHIIDRGLTQIPADSLTVAAFPPSSKYKDIMKNFKLCS